MGKITDIKAQRFALPLKEVLSDAMHGDHTHFELICATITLDNGLSGTGYSYTGGKGGHARQAKGKRGKGQGQTTTRKKEDLREAEGAAVATSEGVMDNRTRLLLRKLVNHGVIDEMHGVLRTGKEASIYHALAAHEDADAVAAERPSIRHHRGSTGAACCASGCDIRIYRQRDLLPRRLLGCVAGGRANGLLYRVGLRHPASRALHAASERVRARRS